MFQYIYDNLKGISPMWWFVLAVFVFKNVYSGNKVYETIEGSLVEKIDDFDAFNKSIKENDVAIVDFSASWCPPCRAAAPVFAKLSKEYPDIKFVNVDVDTNSKAARAMEIR